MNFFKYFQKAIVVHCYTANPEVFNFAPIKPAASFIPDWWKQIPKSYARADSIAPLRTMKHCYGFTALFTKGFVIPMWSDLAVEIGPKGTSNYRYMYANAYSSALSQDIEQRGTAYPELNFQHLKLEAPWLIKCNDNIDFLQLGVVWNQEDPSEMTILPGVVNFKYQVASPVNVLWKRQNNTKNYLLEFGAPLCHYVPLTDRRIKIQTHLVSPEELKRIRSVVTPLKFINKYNANKKMQKQNGCPFQHTAEN